MFKYKMPAAGVTRATRTHIITRTTTKTKRNRATLMVIIMMV